MELIRQLQEEEEEAAEAIRKLEKQKHDESLQLALLLQQQEEEEASLELIGQLQKQQQQKEEAAEAIRKLEKQKHDESLQLALLLQQQEEEEAEKWAKKRKPNLSKDEVWQSLHPCQRKALAYVQGKSLDMHTKCMEKLRKRIQDGGAEKFGGGGGGSDHSDLLDRCLRYIRDDAPIVIHLKEETLRALVKDTHYRNLFETGTSGGNKNKDARAKWEAKLFNGAYNKAEASLRPKYGCLNVSGDIRGVRPAQHYGTFVMTLAPHTRYRSTFSDRDTGNHPTYSLATHDCYAHVLDQYADPDLRAALNVQLCGASSKCTVYKEVQIHGLVCLETDVQALSVPGREAEAPPELLETVAAFQKKTGCNILWQSDLLGL